jgi:hypothetical protein
MSGYKDFNFPAFHAAAAWLRAQGHVVFSPAENDIETLGEQALKSETGDQAEAAKHGFSLRKALADDTRYICLEADAIAMLPGWEKSGGARAEHALAVTLGHKVIYL